MILPQHSLAGAAIAALILAGPACSGVTADEVWQGWQDAAARAGGLLSATPRREGDRLVLGGLAWQPDRMGGATVLIDRVTLAERPDGSVAVLLPERFPVILRPDRTATALDIELAVAAPNLAIAVRALDPAALDFDATAPSISVTLDEDAFRRAEPAGDGFAALAVADLALHWTQDLEAEAVTLDSAFSLGTLHGEFDSDTPQDGRVTARLDVTGLSTWLRGELPLLQEHMAAGSEDLTLPQLLDLLAAGAFLDMGIANDKVDLLIDIIDPDRGPMLLDLSSASGRSALHLDKVAAEYEAATHKTRVRLRPNDPALPFGELTASLDEYRTVLGLGLEDLTRPQPWTLVYRLANLGVSENVWAELDPQEILPRDPVSMVLDLSGTLALKPEAMEDGFALPVDAPPPLTALAAVLNELRLEGLGVRLTGEGALDFDLTDITTYDGAPLPAGTLSFVTTGATALIDRLSRMKGVEPDQINGLRFALLFLGKAGAEPDTLTTRIEFRDKSLYLNGQKLR